MAEKSMLLDLLKDTDVHTMGMLLESGSSGSLHMTFSSDVVRRAIQQPLPPSAYLAGANCLHTSISPQSPGHISYDVCTRLARMHEGPTHYLLNAAANLGDLHNNATVNQSIQPLRLTCRKAPGGLAASYGCCLCRAGPAA